MAREPFGPDDLGAINLVLRQHPRLADLVRLVRRIGQHATYPITSFSVLADALGGEEATVQFGDRELPLAELGRMIPAYYFPIASEDDLVAKLVEIIRMRRGKWMRHGPGTPHQNVVFRHRGRGGWGPRMAAFPPPWAAGWPPPQPPTFHRHESFGPPMGPPAERPE